MSIVERIARANVDHENRSRLGEFGMLARSLLLAGEGGLPQALANAQQARATSNVVEILRTAVAAGTTTGADWAAPLVGFQQLASAFLASLRSESAVQAILTDGGFVQVPINSKAIVVTIGAEGSGPITELQKKPVSKLSIDASDPLTFLKAVVIVATSGELLRFSGPLGTALITGELRSALAVKFDEIVLSVLLANTGVPSQPAAGDMSDLEFLLGSVSTSSGSRLYFIGTSDAIKSFSLRNSGGLRAHPDLGAQGGELVGIPTLISDGLPDGTLVLLDAAQIAFSDGGVVLDQSRHASLPLSDDGTGQAHSLWQANMLALRAERTFAVQALGENCLSYISGIGST